ncbi:MAG: TIGR03757 family integrating conjugative element protein [Gammaproteobacteria bacterium]|nr:TIGR03757 family integrating conjugative element protein [Gammaproteobacteria bacterium]
MSERQQVHIPVLLALVIFVLASTQLLPVAFASEELPGLIEVFTVTGERITGQDGLLHATQGEGLEVRIYALDGIKDLEARVSKDLPGDPGQARRMATDRISQFSETDRARLQRTAVGLARAVHYGIDRHPAMVFNGQAVVYGLTDLSAGLHQYRHWQRP